jgi:hypothetical protein
VYVHYPTWSPVNLIFIQIWYSAGVGPHSLENLDQLFALPSPLAVFSLLWKFLEPQTLLVVLISLYIRSLVIINSSAPNALSIEIEGTKVIEGQVPTLNLSELLIYNSTDECTNCVDRGGLWKQLFKQLATTESTKLWDPPPQCTANCSFEIIYDAPIVSCQDIRLEELSLGLFDPQVNPVNWTFYRVDIPFPLVVYPLKNHVWKFNITYIPAISRGGSLQPLEVTYTGAPRGISCQTSHGKYLGKFSLNNYQKSASTALLSAQDVLNIGCRGETMSESCRNYYFNSNGMIAAFLGQILGHISWEYEERGVEAIQSMEDPFLFRLLFQYMVNFSPELTEVSLSPYFDNLSRAVEDLFVNLTLGTMLRLNQTSTSHIIEWGAPSWKYRSKTLWKIWSGSRHYVTCGGLWSFLQSLQLLRL